MFIKGFRNNSFKYKVDDSAGASSNSNDKAENDAFAEFTDEKVEDKDKKEVVVEDKDKKIVEPKPTDKELALMQQLDAANKRLGVIEPLLKDKLDGKEPVKTEVASEKPKSLKEQLIVRKEDLEDFNSADPVRQESAVKNMITYMHDITVQSVFQLLDHQKKLQDYSSKTSKAFYEKYPKLDKFREVVKVVGDEINKKYPDKMPHELLNEIGDECLAILNRAGVTFAPTTNNDEKLVVRKGGEGSNTKIVEELPKPLTDQEKEMKDLEHFA